MLEESFLCYNAFMQKKILIIGNGAKEYALAKKLSEKHDVFITPASDTLKEFAHCLDIREDNVSELLEFVVENGIDLTVPISAKALASDIVSTFNNNNQQVFAPCKEAVNLIFDKAYAKKVLYKLRIPTPKFGIFEKQNMVLDYIKNLKNPFVLKTNDSKSAAVFTSYQTAKKLLTAAVSVGAPVDLVAGSNLLRFGFNRLYSKMFLDTLIPKVIKKCEQMPEMRKIVDEEAIKKCKNFYDFDSLYTAPVHGFKSAMDYWTKASAKPWLKYVEVPLLLLNAKNDPFMPEWALPTLNDVSDFVWLDQPEEGGHVGFPTGNPPGKIDYLPNRIFRFFTLRQ